MRSKQRRKLRKMLRPRMPKTKRPLARQRRTKDSLHVNNKLQQRLESSLRTLMTLVQTSSVTLESSNLNAQNKKDSIKFTLLSRTLVKNMLARQLEFAEESTTHVLKVKCVSLLFVKDMLQSKLSCSQAKASAKAWLTMYQNSLRNLLLK